MADETLEITFSKELLAEIDDYRTAGHPPQKPLAREDAVLRLVKAGYEAIFEKHMRALTEEWRSTSGYLEN
jgi:hypothetical protein